MPAPATAELYCWPVVSRCAWATARPRWSRRPAPRSCALAGRWRRPRWASGSSALATGAGTKVFADRPNVLRLMVGERVQTYDTDELVEIAANIDDLNPQIYDHVVERLFETGARDVTLTPTIMKKGRPAVTISVLAEPSAREQIAAVLFAETSTIGLRYHPVSRIKLAREIEEVETRWGRVRVKVSRAGDDTVTLSPEYDDCRRLAREHHVALRLILEQAQAVARRQISSDD